MLLLKIKEVDQLYKKLKAQRDRIDNEVERAMTDELFNQMTAGGLQASTVENIIKESEPVINAARRMNQIRQEQR